MNYIDFRKKIVADKEFGAKFAGCKTPADLIKAAAAEGYTFTEDDIKNNTDLLPEELEKSAGGTKWAAYQSWFVGEEYIVTTKD